MYTIQVTITELNVFEVETFETASEMFARYTELIADQPSGTEVECFVK